MNSPAIHRKNKRTDILALFVANLRRPLSSAVLHGRFGSSFRTRVSELNSDAACPITIKNRIDFIDGMECSVYWSEPKAPMSIAASEPPAEHAELFPDFAPEPRHRDDG